VSPRGAWRWLTSPRGSRGGFSAWGCPGSRCAGIFRSPEKANEHAWAARVTGTHDAPEQRRLLRERNRVARQLRRRGRSR
jgi:hypothetical protein